MEVKASATVKESDLRGLKRLASVAGNQFKLGVICLLYTSDAADERSSVDLGGRRIIKKKKRDV